ncbi:hypothetical protein GGR58DRAFT_474685 [Xylaria digitata]|nr:hypothetical protein GGR58DRAFT_474685 [Xylaria digitata]
MKDEDLSITEILLIIGYVLPVGYMTAEMVAEYLASAYNREPRSWWIKYNLACFTVGFSLCISLFIFYLFFAIPLMILKVYYVSCAWSSLGGAHRVGPAASRWTDADHHDIFHPAGQCELESGERSELPTAASLGKKPVLEDRPASAPATSRSEIRRRHVASFSPDNEYDNYDVADV